MILNCVSRLSGGIILDYVKFKHFFGIILALSITLSLTFVLVAESKIGFVVYLAISYFISGSIFVSTPIYYA